MKNSWDITWPELTRGTLLKRYKRFLVDVKLDSGEEITAHCNNTGTMKTCCEPGRPVYLSYHDNPKRKYKYSLELIEMPATLVGVNTIVPNKLVAQSIATGKIPELSGYDNVRTEVKTNDGTRLDIVIDNQIGEKCFIEVKNCTMVNGRVASFPDAVTQRGRKHLEELLTLKNKNNRSVIFFLVQRSDADFFKPADDIDPEYGKVLREVSKNGVEILVYDVVVTTEGIRLNRPLPYNL